MIQSMTGFSSTRSLYKDESEYLIEIKSVNTRFLEAKFKMPQKLKSLELDMKNIVKTYFRRGSFDISINIKSVKDKNISLDMSKISAYITFIKKIQKENSIDINVNGHDFIKDHYFHESITSITGEEKDLIFKSLNESLRKILEVREEEGQKLKISINSHIEKFKNNLEGIKSRRDMFLQEKKKKLMKKFEYFSDLKEIDKERFQNELVYYLEKLDIDEEIERLDSHLSKIAHLFEAKDEVGRELDFFIQELGRETNTIGSKSVNKEISSFIVPMKLSLEKMREQIQNIQ